MPYTAPVMVGRQIGPYILERILGRGGMGEVYAARDDRLQRRVAIKRVRTDRDDDVRRERLRREARMLARLKHPAIVSIFDIIEQEDGDWLVMELVEGVRLDELLLDGPVAPTVAVDYASQIVQGLAESHGKGILHRDLKTENIMVTAEDQLRILDFGLAKPLARDGEPSLSEADQVLGTVRAMSPEQARGLALDERSDLFSLGVLIYELLVGDSPFVGATPNATLVKVCSERHRSAHDVDPAIPEPLSALIDDLLRKPPGARPASARAVAERLVEIRLAMRDVLEHPSRAGLEASHETPADTPADTPDSTDEELRGERGPAVASRAGAENGAWHERAIGASSRRRSIRMLIPIGVAALGVMSIAVYVATSGSTSPRTPASRDPGPVAAASATPGPAASASRSYQLLQAGRAHLARYDRKGAIDAAVEAFTELSALQPDSAAAHAGLAHAYYRKYHNRGRTPRWLELARAATRRALALDDHLAWAHLAHARIAHTDGDTDVALRALARVLELEPTSAPAYLEYGRNYWTQGARDKAEAAFRRGLELAPDDRALLDELGTLMYKGGRLDEAESVWRRSIEVAPDSVYGYRNLAAALHALNRPDEAAAILQRGLEVQPHASLYSNLGTLYFFQGAYADAAVAFERALEVGGGAQDYWRWADLGDALRQIPGRGEGARRAYRTAVRLARAGLANAPDDVRLRTRTALYLARAGQLDAARTTLVPLTERNPLGSAAHYRMAVTFELCGERALALERLERALTGGYPRQEAAREPDLDGLRASPAYQRLLERIPLQDP